MILDHAAGIDSQLLQQCPKAERIKYKCMGGFILLYCLMSSLAMAYALTAIFLPSESDTPFFVAVYIGSGLCWFLFNYNLYRFLFSATRCADGESGISWHEIVIQWPQLLLLLLLALCFSMSASVALLHDGVRLDITAKQFQSIETHRLELEHQVSDALQAAYVTQANILQQHLLAADAQLESSKGGVTRTSRVDENLTQKQFIIEAIRNDIAQKQAVYERQIRNLDGFFNTAEKIMTKYPTLVLWFVILGVLMQWFPVLVKMMWAKGPYEYQVEFQNKLVVSKHGICREVFWHGGVMYQNDLYLAAKLLERFNIARL